MEKQKEYFVFISYKSEDEEWAIWLQHELEHYHLPASFNGRTDVRKDLKPIFRDIDELSAGNLPLQIEQALVNSQNLIVICSPQAAASPWVNLEVETFISLGRTSNIFPFIVEGNSPSEFYPPALLDLPKNEERIGGDVSKNGRDAAFVKIVAGMLRLDYDSLWNRYEKEKAEEERKQREQRDNLLRLKSRVIAEKAIDLIAEGDSYTARLLALEVLPTPLHPDYPYTPEAEHALRACMVYDTAILRGHSENVEQAILSDNCEYIASVSDDHTLKIWSSSNGKLLYSFDNSPCSYNTIRFSLDNRSILACYSSWNESHISVWDIDTGELLYHFIGTTTKECLEKCDILDNYQEPSYIKKHKEKRRVTHFRNTATINSTITGNIITVLTGHEADITSSSFSSNGKFVVTSSRDGTARVWSSQKGTMICVLEGHNDKFVNTAFFSPDGTQIVTASNDETIKIWKATNGRLIKTLKGHTNAVNSAIFSLDSKWILSASEDHTCRLWDMINKEEKATLFGHRKSVTCVNFSCDGKYMISSSSDGTIKIWDAIDNWKLIKTFMNVRKRISYVTFSPDGNQILFSSFDNSISVLDFQSERKLFSIVCQKPGISSFVYSANYSHDGRKIITALRNSNIKCWSSKDGSLLATIDWDTEDCHIGDVLYVEFSHDDNLIVSAGVDGNVKLWDAKSYRIICTLKGHSSAVWHALFTNDDKCLITTSSDYTIIIWDIEKRSIIKRIDGHIRAVRTLTISPDDRVFATASDDKSIKVWDFKTGFILATYEGHSNNIENIAFSPDGKTIASASYDSTIKIWDFLPLEELVQKAIEKCGNRKLTPEERRKYYLE